MQPVARKLLCLGVSFLAFLFLLPGCGHKQQKVTVAHRMLLNEIHCIGILPLLNRSKQPNAHLIVADLLANEIRASRMFSVIGSADIRRVLEKNEIALPIENDPTKIREVGQLVRAQGILAGDVIEYGYRDPVDQGEEEPFVAIQLKLYHLPTGTPVWTSVVHRSSREIVSRNRDPLSRVALLTVEELIRLLTQSIQNRAPKEGPQRCGIWTTGEGQ